jgi:hypothetical protein
MLSASASIPPATQVVFAVAFGESTTSASSRRSYRPADSPSRNAGTTPASDTTFGSSKVGRIV